jgi:hypothetical protein
LRFAVAIFPSAVIARFRSVNGSLEVGVFIISNDQHGISVAEEPVILLYRFAIG